MIRTKILFEFVIILVSVYALSMNMNNSKILAVYAEIEPQQVFRQHLGEFIMTGDLFSLSGCSTSPGIYAFTFRLHEQYVAQLAEFCCHWQERRDLFFQ